VRKLLFVCFVVVLVTWMSFVYVTKELRRGALITPETHIVMSSLIFCLVLILVPRLTSFMDLTIAHMVLVHERTTLCLDDLITVYVLIVMIASHVGPVFLFEGLVLTLSPDTWTVHTFPIIVHILMDEMVRC
jgi:hypothetical protein